MNSYILHSSLNIQSDVNVKSEARTWFERRLRLVFLVYRESCINKIQLSFFRILRIKIIRLFL